MDKKQEEHLKKLIDNEVEILNQLNKERDQENIHAGFVLLLCFISGFVFGWIVRNML